MDRHRRWLAVVSMLAAPFFFLPPGINFLIDPWGLNDLFHIEGVNTTKLDVHMHTRLHKAHAVRRLQPATMILGISRSAQGIRTDHPAWDTPPVYNLSLDGGTIAEVHLFLEGTLTTAPIKRVIIGLDFESFVNLSWREKPDTREALAVLDSPFSSLKSYFTVEMLKASRLITKRQHIAVTAILPGGETPVVSFEKALETTGGHRNLFRRSEEEYFKYRYSNSLRDVDGSSGLGHLVSIVNLARQHNVELRLFVSPVHARQMEVIRQLGLWSLFEQWKRETVAILAEDAAKHPVMSPIPLWDFSGYNSLTTEDVPPAGDTGSKMRWYWESSHYKPALGDLVLDRVFGHTESGRRIPDDFGVLLGTDNIDSHLSRIRNDQARYHKTHAADVAEIEELFLRSERTGRN